MTTPTPGPRCDYCDEGNLAVDGWHVYTDDEDGTSYRVPCAVDPPKGEA